MHDPTATLDRIAAAVRTNLPPGVTPAYFDGFLQRHRPTLLQILEAHLAPPEAWTAAKRTQANLDAMRVAATVPPDKLTDADRRGCGRRGPHGARGRWSAG